MDIIKKSAKIRQVIINNYKIGIINNCSTMPSEFCTQINCEYCPFSNIPYREKYFKTNILGLPLYYENI